MPLTLIASCFSKIQIGFTSLVPAQLGIPGQSPEGCKMDVCWCVCVCVCVCLCACVHVCVGVGSDNLFLQLNKENNTWKMLTSRFVNKCHCVEQLWDCDPMWWIFESSNIKDQYQVSAWMVSAYWREMPYTSLTKSWPEIWNHNHICGCACLSSNELSKFLLSCFFTDSEWLNIQCIADCKAGKLVECNSQFFNHLNIEIRAPWITKFFTVLWNKF